MEDLKRLSELITHSNAALDEVAAHIGRPALIGHVGEYIASRIFGIALVESASNKAIDGYFRAGALAGQSVNVKWYSTHQGTLDITPRSLPDFYLVLSGPAAPASSSRGKKTPWTIERVHLFNAADLLAALKSRGTRAGVATSVTAPLWRAAEIYPCAACDAMTLSDGQRDMLRMFKQA